MQVQSQVFLKKNILDSSYTRKLHLLAYCAGSKPSLARFGIVTHTDLTLAQRYGAHYDKKSTL